MPVMTGEELVYKMRENKKFNKVRVIMATKGVNGYLVKAFDAVYSRIPKE